MPSLPSYKHPVDSLNEKLCLMHEVLLLFGCNIDVHIGIGKGNYKRERYYSKPRQQCKR